MPRRCGQHELKVDRRATALRCALLDGGGVAQRFRDATGKRKGFAASSTALARDALSFLGRQARGASPPSSTPQQPGEVAWCHVSIIA